LGLLYGAHGGLGDVEIPWSTADVPLFRHGDEVLDLGKAHVPSLPRRRVLDDGWTVVTADGSLSAQFEHTVLVTREGFEILTTVPTVTL
jgi:methionine aminopeptidase